MSGADDRSKEARAERLAAALRDNLRRRKAQARTGADSDREPPARSAPMPDLKP